MPLRGPCPDQIRLLPVSVKVLTRLLLVTVLVYGQLMPKGHSGSQHELMKTVRPRSPSDQRLYLQSWYYYYVEGGLDMNHGDLQISSKLLSTVSVVF